MEFYFPPLLSFLLFLPTSVFSNQKPGAQLFPGPYMLTVPVPCSPFLNIFRALHFLPGHALIQTFTLRPPDPCNSLLLWFLLSDLMWSAPRAVIPKHESGLTTSHLVTPQICQKVSKIMSNLLVSQQSLPWLGLAWLLSHLLPSVSVGHTKLTSPVDTNYMGHAPSAQRLSSTPFHLCSGLGSSRELSSAPRWDYVSLTCAPIIASKQLFPCFIKTFHLFSWW